MSDFMLMEPANQSLSELLGNMLLLGQDELGRADLATKKSQYLKTSFKLARKVARYYCWNLTNLNDYQFWLAGSGG